MPRVGLDDYLHRAAIRQLDGAGELAELITALATAVVAIADRVGRGVLGGQHGAAGTHNVHGERQAGLDLAGNEIVVRETQWGGQVAGLVSEEFADVYPVPDRFRRGRYLLAVDPLDGSSNIEINIPVGTIFSVLRRDPVAEPGSAPARTEFLQPGRSQVAAGFALYGPATMLVLTTGAGVDGFTYDRERAEFVLTHHQMRIPGHACEFAINSSNERFWDPPVRRYVAECLAGQSGPRGRDYNMRWVASLVAETYRILTRGGVFLYPGDSRAGTASGRLRLLYECNPIAFIVEQAGGAASTGRGRALEVRPTGLPQRIPFVFGAREDVNLIEAYHRDATPGADFSLFNARSLYRGR